MSYTANYRTHPLRKAPSKGFPRGWVLVFLEKAYLDQPPRPQAAMVNRTKNAWIHYLQEKIQ